MEKVESWILGLTKKHPIIVGLLFPVIVVLTVNLGLIFNWPLLLDFKPISTIINYISIKDTYEFPPDYFIGIITVFILFFSFAQFSYSRQTLPANLVREHILFHHLSLLFIASQLSFSSIIAFFTFVNSHSIHNFNFVIVIVLILCSIILSILYFYWLIKVVTPVGMFLLIRDKLNFDEIKKIEVASEENVQKFLLSLQSKGLKLKYTLFDYFGFMVDEFIPIQTEKIGIVKSIDINKIDDILSKHSETIKEIILDIKIGQRIPLYDPYPEISLKTTLLRIHTKIGNIDKPKELLNVEALQKSVVECFKFEKRSEIFEINRKNLYDLIKFYIYAVENEPSESKDLMQHFSTFTLTKIIAPQNNLSIRLTEKLLLDIIEIFNDKLGHYDLNTRKIEITLSFIYSMRNAAVKGKSFLLISNLLSLLVHLFSRYINSEFVRSNRIYSIILSIQEIAFSEIAYTGEYDNKKELLKYYKSFYLPLIRDSLEQAAMAFYILIKSFQQVKVSSIIVITENAQHLINFLSPLDHWKPLEKLAFENSPRYKIESGKILRSHAQNILYLSVYIFKSVKEKKLPINFLNEIAFSLVNNCQTIKKFQLTSEDLLDEFFFSYEFRELNYSFLRDEFEVNKVHEAGAYSPLIFSFRDFWLTYSLYRAINPIYLQHSKISFLPSKDKSKTNFSKSMIVNLIDRLSSISVKDLTIWLNQDEYTIREVMMKYGDHLRGLL